jgi:hypothetical protein
MNQSLSVDLAACTVLENTTILLSPSGVNMNTGTETTHSTCCTMAMAMMAMEGLRAEGYGLIAARCVVW